MFHVKMEHNEEPVVNKCETFTTGCVGTVVKCESDLDSADCHKPELQQTKEKPRSKPQICKICGKLLASSSSYYVHMKLHSGEKPYQCGSCEASFTRKPYLEAHLRTHTGERPFQCTVCFKWFTQKSSLNTHKRVHTGERPYTCDLCGKKFAVKSYLTAHRWSHLADMPLVCGICDITFNCKHDFALHSKMHATGINFECHICGRTFSKEGYLNRHVTRVHQNLKMMGSDAMGEQNSLISDPGMCNSYTSELTENVVEDPAHLNNIPTSQQSESNEVDSDVYSSDILIHSAVYNHFMVPC